MILSFFTGQQYLCIGNLLPGNAKKHQKRADSDNKSARLLLIQMEKTNFASAIHSNRLSKQ